MKLNFFSKIITVKRSIVIQLIVIIIIVIDTRKCIRRIN